jgi:hypothetical protein
VAHGHHSPLLDQLGFRLRQVSKVVLAASLALREILAQLHPVERAQFMKELPDIALCTHTSRWIWWMSASTCLTNAAFSAAFERS